MTSESNKNGTTNSRERDKMLVETFRDRYHSGTLDMNDPVIKKVTQRVEYWCRSYKCMLDAPEVTDHVLDQLLKCSFGTTEARGKTPLRSFIDTTTKRKIWRIHSKALDTEPVDDLTEVLTIERKVIKRMEEEVYMKERLRRMPPLRRLILFTVYELYDHDPPSRREVINRVFARTSTCAANHRCTLRCFEGETKACYFLAGLKLGKKVTKYKIGSEYDQAFGGFDDQGPVNSLGGT